MKNDFTLGSLVLMLSACTSLENGNAPPGAHKSDGTLEEVAVLECRDRTLVDGGYVVTFYKTDDKFSRAELEAITRSGTQLLADYTHFTWLAGTFTPDGRDVFISFNGPSVGETGYEIGLTGPDFGGFSYATITEWNWSEFSVLADGLPCEPVDPEPSTPPSEQSPDAGRDAEPSPDTGLTCCDPASAPEGGIEGVECCADGEWHTDRGDGDACSRNGGIGAVCNPTN